MNRELLVVFVALMAAAIFVPPVMAIGPFGALENENARFSLDPFGGIVNWRVGEPNVGGGYITWSSMEEGAFWMEWRWFDAGSGQGKAKNAIPFVYPATFIQFGIDEGAYADGLPTVNENKWIFVDADVKMTHPKYGSHGMVWWFYYTLSGGQASVADLVEGLYPEGAFWQYNFIG